MTLAPLLAVLLAAPASAALLNGAEEAAVVPGEPSGGGPLAFARLNGLPTEPLSEKLRAVKTMAGALTFRRDIGSDGSTGPTNGAYSEKTTGLVAAVSYLRGWSEHWGWSATAAYARSVGRMTKFTPFHVSADGDVLDDGASADLSLLYDPLGGEGFRVPLALGAEWWWLNGRRGPMDFVFPAGGSYAGVGHRGEIVETYRGSTPALSFAAAPQRDLGDFRAVGYFWATVAFRKPRNAYTERDLTNGVSADAGAEAGRPGGAGVALELVYKPWGLSAVVAPPLAVRGKDAGKLGAYALRWNRRF